MPTEYQSEQDQKYNDWIATVFLIGMALGAVIVLILIGLYYLFK